MKSLIGKNLAKSYGKRSIVKDVTIEVKQGEIVGLLGPNGAGKTTCFYMIVGLVSADYGSIFIGDDDVSDLPIHGRAKKGLGYLPQEASIFRRLTVFENIMAILELRKELTKKLRIDKVNELLDDFNIQHIKNSLGMALSGGERRRVEIARSLANNPEFVLLDEPFAGVDPISVGDIKDIVHKLNTRGIGVLMTDHNVRETLDICQRAYIVSNGHIIANGNAEEILGNQQVKDVYLGDQFKL